MDVREPQVREVWTFGEDGVTPKVHPTARVDVGAGFVVKFATNYLTEDGVGSLCLAVIPLMEASSGLVSLLH